MLLEFCYETRVWHEFNSVDGTYPTTQKEYHLQTPPSVERRSQKYSQSNFCSFLTGFETRQMKTVCKGCLAVDVSRAFERVARDPQAARFRSRDMTVIGCLMDVGDGARLGTRGGNLGAFEGSTKRIGVLLVPPLRVLKGTALPPPAPQSGTFCLVFSCCMLLLSCNQIQDTTFWATRGHKVAHTPGSAAGPNTTEQRMRCRTPHWSSTMEQRT